MTLLFISSCRSDLSILQHPIKYFQKHANFKNFVYIGGYNFDIKSSGNTDMLKKIGFNNLIYSKISKNKNFDYKDTNVANFMIQEVKEIIKKKKIKYILILGDRFEILAAAFAAASAKIPIAHIHGGESTLGILDECIRHSVTKMSAKHFVSTKEYRNRVIQLGENPSNVKVVGALGVERIKKINFFSKKEIEKKLKFNFDKNNILITYHPITLDKNSAHRDMKEIFTALKKVKNTKKIFTMPNADAGGGIIYSMIKKFSKKKSNNSIIFKSLGQKMYFSVMKNSNLVLGNSSSGIIESPSLKIPSLNIGDRQKGRVTASSTITCNPNRNEILKYVNKLLSKKYIKKTKKIKNPYEKKDSSKKIFKKIINMNLRNILKKNFYKVKI